MPVEQGQEGIKQDMERYKRGDLHSDSKTGPIVRNRKQAIAISMKEAGMSKYGNLKNRNNTSMAKGANTAGMSNRGRTY